MKTLPFFLFHPFYYYGKAFKALVRLISNKEHINFAVLGLPQSGKSHFICIVRGEPFDPTCMTEFNGDSVERKEVSIAGKTLVYERGRDINGLILTEYPALIARADMIYFFFRADYFINNDYSEDFVVNPYREWVIQYFGSVIRDPNAINKPIKIIATFKKNLHNMRELSAKNKIRQVFVEEFHDESLDNCGWFIADIDDDHREWVTKEAKQLIFNQK